MNTMKVVVCEDNTAVLKQVSSFIKNYAFMEDNSIDIVLQATSPKEVFTYLETSQADCYFLDIDLNDSITGIDLAQKIRLHSPLATIIFVTTHSEMAHLTFTYRLEALDFIIKDDFIAFQRNIIDALVAAYNKYKKIGVQQEEIYYTITIGEYVKNINMKHILYFKTTDSAHKVRIHTVQGHWEFYTSLSNVEKASDNFFRIHRAYIVNLLNIIEVNKKKRHVVLENGEICPVSVRRLKLLEQALAS